MTEPEWLSSTDPTPILEFLRGKASDRKLILAGVAACRLRIAGELHPLFRAAIEVCERHADRLASPAEVFQLINQFHARADSTGPSSIDRDIRHAVTMLLDMIVVKKRSPGASLSTNAKLVFGSDRTLVPILRCVFHPFPIPLDPHWQTTTVRALAQGIDTDRAFDRLPILADALQDAGCENSALLNHCRSESVHTRGCWAIDALLGKE